MTQLDRYFWNSIDAKKISFSKRKEIVWRCPFKHNSCYLGWAEVQENACWIGCLVIV